MHASCEVSELLIFGIPTHYTVIFSKNLKYLIQVFENLKTGLSEIIEGKV